MPRITDGTGSGTFLPLPEVLRRTSLSRSTLYREIGRGRFPKPYSISVGRVAWLKSDIDAWVEARKSVRGRPYANPLLAESDEPTESANPTDKEVRRGKFGEESACTPKP